MDLGYLKEQKKKYEKLSKELADASKAMSPAFDYCIPATKKRFLAVLSQNNSQPDRSKGKFVYELNNVMDPIKFSFYKYSSVLSKASDELQRKKSLAEEKVSYYQEEIRKEEQRRHEELMRQLASIAEAIGFK